jgi:hypothetical protein
MGYRPHAGPGRQGILPGHGTGLGQEALVAGVTSFRSGEMI